MLVLSAFAGAAAADPAAGADKPGNATVKTAKAHFKMATAYYNVGSYDLAIPEYEAAYKLDERPEFLFNIAQCYRHLNQREKAIDHYRRYVDAVPEGGGADQARAHIAKLSRELKEAGITVEPVPSIPTPEEAARAAQKPAPAVPIIEEPRPQVTAPATPPAPPPKTPLVKRPWFWVVVGGGALVVAGAVTAGVLATSPVDPTPSLGILQFGIR